MSRLNELRYGSLDMVRVLMDTDEPLDEFELRAMVFNLAERLSETMDSIEQLRAQLRGRGSL